MVKPTKAPKARLDRVLQPETTPDRPLVEKKRKDTRFKPGPDPRRQVGRKPGSKNQVTFLRLELEEALRNQLRDDGLEILQKAIQMAKNGNEKVIKVLLDKMLASPKGDDASEAKDNEVRITIQNLTHGEQNTQIAAISHKPEQDNEQ